MVKKNDSCLNCLMRGCVRIFSLILIVGLYALIGMHFWGWTNVVCPLLKKRLGTNFGMLWAAIGIILLYNVVYNHFMAMIIKPGSVEDLKLIEKMRIKDKKRANRKSIEKELKEDNDRFYGLSKEVKQLLKYRHKTIA